VGRRYRKLHRGGVKRVIGLVKPQVYGECQWVIRVRAKPDDVPRLAEALVRRPEVTHANVLSGWTDLVCIVRAPLSETKDGLLQRLPRTSAVLGLEVDLIRFQRQCHAVADDIAAAAAEQIAAHEETATVIAVSGRNNLLAVVICHDVDDLYRYLAERLAGSEQIQSYDLSVRTQRLKRAASLIAHGRLIHPGHA
jgi:DNA-binding Lrp family transcriptional regulator